MGFQLWPTIGHKSRAGQVDHYPFDLDASERITRPKTGIDIFPIQTNATDFAKLGSLNAVYPQMDDFVWNQMYGKDPFGPIVSALPVNLQWQITVPGLNKNSPQY